MLGQLDRHWSYDIGGYLHTIMMDVISYSCPYQVNPFTIPDKISHQKPLQLAGFH